MSKEHSCDGKDEDILEEITLTKVFIVKEVPEIFHNIECTRDKVLEVDTAWKGMIIYQATEKMLVLYYSDIAKRRKMLFKPSCGVHFFLKISKMLKFLVFLRILRYNILNKY